MIQCTVNLKRHVDLNKDPSFYPFEWQKRYDSASDFHPAWAGIENAFKEFCVKSAKDCVVTSITIDNKNIMKNNDMTWREARAKIEEIGKNPTYEDFMKILNFDWKKQKKQFIKQLRKDIGQFRFNNITLRWLLNRWYVFLKMFLTFFYIGNCIWSASHLMNYKTQDGVNNINTNAVISFIVFLVVQGTCNIILLALQGIRSVRKPHKMNLKITFAKLSIAFCSETPMLVSQAFAIKSITQQQNATKQWNDLSWDMALQTQFIFNLILFLIIDLAYYALNHLRFEYKKVAPWIPVGVLSSILITSFIFTPIHIAQLGWTWFPALTLFGERDQLDFNELNDIMSNQLNISMGVGTLGIWMWPVLFFIFSLLAVQRMFDITFKTIGRHWYMSVKAFLVLFNIWNGIWSVQHLFGMSNDRTESALSAFAVFFTLLSLANMFYIVASNIFM